MIHTVNPRQNRLIDPFEGVIPQAGLRIIAEGWQGVFRHVLLELMPVAELAGHFSKNVGTNTKELYSMAGLVWLADFHDWTAQEGAEAYIFRSDVQYALNLEPGASVCSRTIERYQKLFREDELAARVFEDVTIRLIAMLELNVSRQRLDSTHVFSHMAIFGRTKLMAVAIKRFLTQVKRHASVLYAALPEAFRLRYEPAESKLFAGAKDAESRQQSRQQVAEDLFWVIEHFADQPEMTRRTTYQVLTTIFTQQCEVVAGKVKVRAAGGGDRIQNPSDLDATYDGKKGSGYQTQLTETCVPENEVQLITAVLPQTACTSDASSFVPMLEQLRDAERLPEEMLADTAFGSDENVQAAAALGVELIAPVPGRTPQRDPEALSIDDFAVDERTGAVAACPAGHAPLWVDRDAQSGTTRLEMPAPVCVGCAFQKQCPIQPTETGRFLLNFTDKDRRLAERRAEQETEVFQERYAQRAGIESTNSGLKNRLGLGQLRVRGQGSVFRVLLHKVAGWNVLRAAASKTMRAWVATKVSETLRGCEWGRLGQHCGPVAWFRGHQRESLRRNGWQTSRLRPGAAA
jgi:hypothetical protein